RRPAPRPAPTAGPSAAGGRGAAGSRRYPRALRGRARPPAPAPGYAPDRACAGTRPAGRPYPHCPVEWIAALGISGPSPLVSMCRKGGSAVAHRNRTVDEDATQTVDRPPPRQPVIDDRRPADRNPADKTAVERPVTEKKQIEEAPPR